VYIEQAKIASRHRCFKKGQKFNFRDITVIVGDQGCGKSTLLKGLQAQDKFLDLQMTPFGLKGVNSFYFDSEHMNPRTTDPTIYPKANGEDIGIGYAGSIISRFKSHGEVLKMYTVDCLKKVKDSVILLDEPEAGLSLRNQFQVWDEVTRASNRKCQIIIATHSLVIIQAARDVLSLEHGKWMKSDDFIRTQKMGSGSE
jgi:predicted ATPase